MGNQRIRYHRQRRNNAIVIQRRLNESRRRTRLIRRVNLNAQRRIRINKSRTLLLARRR